MNLRFSKNGIMNDFPKKQGIVKGFIVKFLPIISKQFKAQNSFVARSKVLLVLFVFSNSACVWGGPKKFGSPSQGKEPDYVPSSCEVDSCFTKCLKVSYTCGGISYQFDPQAFLDCNRSLHDFCKMKCASCENQ